MSGRSDREGLGAHERALAAQNVVSETFLALDNEQRAVAHAVFGATELGLGPDLRGEWQRVAELGDKATIAYSSVMDEQPRARIGARHFASDSAVRQAAEDIAEAREAIRRFAATHSDTLEQAMAAISSIPRLIGQANSVLTEARAAISASEAAGLRSTKATRSLTEAEQGQTTMNQPGGGLRERRATARRVLQLAQQARDAALDAPNVALRARSALTSVTTRRTAAETKADRARQTLSTLRREFAEACFVDVEGAPERISAALSDADQALRLVHTHIAGQAWDEATDQIAAARAALARAETEADSVTNRLAELREVAADPSSPAEAVRFVVRDAQRLVVDRGQVAKFGCQLDEQVARLETVRKSLRRPHPNYMQYLDELRKIRARVADVVAQVRASGS